MLNNFFNLFKKKELKIIESALQKDINNSISHTIIGSHAICLLKETTKQGEELASRFGIEFFEVSAFNNFMIDECFDRLIEETYR